ncbi:MAG: DUF368 domain-containing protein [Opitutales bacterium]
MAIHNTTNRSAPLKSFVQSLKVFLVGICMGIADLIPGVSGGTIAFICGIYDRLINGIKRFDLEALRLLFSGRMRELWHRPPCSFFIPLGLGIVTAILSLSHLLESLFESHPVHLWSFFFGLILGSILLLNRETRPWKARDWWAFAIAAAATYLVVGIDAIQTPPSPLYLFLAGCIAVSAMILPGISGSYILVILGKYQQVLEALNARDLAAIGCFMAGLVVGVLTIVRIVSWLLRHFRQVTMVALTGIMAGALRTVWPWKETLTTRIDSSGETVPLSQRNVLPADGGDILPSLLLLLVGALVVLGLHRLNPREEPTPHETPDKP